MFTATANLYDLIYSFKDYADEAAKLRALIRKEHPAAKTILDVACGTAEHAKLLSSDFNIDGIDLDPKLSKSQKPKIPPAISVSPIGSVGAALAAEGLGGG